MLPARMAQTTVCKGLIAVSIWYYSRYNGIGRAGSASCSRSPEH
jgi:hypothetical protein